MLGHHISIYLSDQTNERRSGQRTSAALAEIHPGKRQQKEEAMSEISTGNHHEAGQYEIRLKGHLDIRWATWFDGLSLTNESDGTTIIHGLVADQAALHGLLQKVRDAGLPLVSVTQVEPDQPDVPTIEPR
jgi:hypothetical protein